MLQTVVNAGLCFFLVVAIAAGLATAYFYLRALWGLPSRHKTGFYAEVQQAIAESGLAKAQQGWIAEVYLPRMIEYRRLSRSANRQFSLLSKSSVLSPYLAGGIGVATMTVLQSYWMWGAFLGAIFGGLGLLARAFNAIDANALRWVDYEELAGQMEETLTELLTDDTDREIKVRWKQFRQEYELICRRAQELMAARTQAAQTAAVEASSAAQTQLENLKHSRRDNPADRNPVRQPEFSGATIDGPEFRQFTDRLRHAPFTEKAPLQISFPDDGDDLLPSEALTAWRK